MQKHFLILDFGSQYTQLIARRLRDLKIYAKILPYNGSLENIQSENPIGFILSGSPSSATNSNLPLPSSNQKKKNNSNALKSHSLDIDQLLRMAPILGICYGMQLICRHYGGHIETSKSGEFGQSEIHWKQKYIKNIPLKQKVWMSYGDQIKIPPPGFEVLAFSETKAPSVIKSTNGKILAFQFHPEVSHTEQGTDLIKYFAFEICKAKPEWQAKNIIKQTIKEIQAQVPPNENVLCALSGGVDSSVVALLLKKALGPKRIHLAFIDTGFLRKGEFEEVIKSYEKLNLDVQAINSKEFFLNKVKKIISPEKKRKAIGHAFVDVFKFFLKKKPNVKWLAQGTLYPDVIESSSSNEKEKNNSVTIKTHHNVGGLPKDLNLKLLEPLRDLYKDEVREIGKNLGLPNSILHRHPFPGPGLAIRILGAVTKEKLRILKKADALFTEELKKSKFYSSTWQALAVLLPVKTVGVQGDQRTYGNIIALRAVLSVDGMTANWASFPPEFLNQVSKKITNNIKEINRVVYDITNKPPGTIEWE